MMGRRKMINFDDEKEEEYPLCDDQKWDDNPLDDERDDDKLSLKTIAAELQLIRFFNLICFYFELMNITILQGRDLHVMAELRSDSCH